MDAYTHTMSAQTLLKTALLLQNQGTLFPSPEGQLCVVHKQLDVLGALKMAQILEPLRMHEVVEGHSALHFVPARVPACSGMNSTVPKCMNHNRKCPRNN